MFPPAEERAERQRSWAGPLDAPHPRHAWLVAEQAGRVVGFAVVGPARDGDLDAATTGELRIVLVEARARGLGVGSALIAAAERALRDSSFLAATLWVLPDNAQAVRCYERCGWRAGASKRTEIRSVRYERRLTA
jgi:GNAT superfamily N-acetyltransferase